VVPALAHRDMLNTLDGNIRRPLPWLLARFPSCVRVAIRQAQYNDETFDDEGAIHGPTTNIDGVLIQWGDRLFYPDNRVVWIKSQPRLDVWGEASMGYDQMAACRNHGGAAGGGEGHRGRAGDASHCCALSFHQQKRSVRCGRRTGETLRGRDAVHELTDLGTQLNLFEDCHDLASLKFDFFR
jgi:hypothetical protein